MKAEAMYNVLENRLQEKLKSKQMGNPLTGSAGLYQVNLTDDQATILFSACLIMEFIGNRLDEEEIFQKDKPCEHCWVTQFISDNSGGNYMPKYECSKCGAWKS